MRIGGGVILDIEAKFNQIVLPIKPHFLLLRYELREQAVPVEIPGVGVGNIAKVGILDCFGLLTTTSVAPANVVSAPELSTSSFKRWTTRGVPSCF